MDETYQAFKRGDYTLHFYLEEARALLGDSADATIDPVVSLSCFSKVKSTKVIEDIGSSVFWGEHFFFEKDQAEPEELMEASLIIEVKDHNTLTRDTLIGSFSVDLSYLYAQEDHSIIHKWVILSNPSVQDYETVRGYLKFGVTLAHESDKRIDLTVKETVSKTEMDILMPPEIKPKACQLVIKLLKAESLPVLDSMSGSLDAYCTAKIAGSSIKSKVITADKETLSAYWYEELLMPFIEPSLSSKLSLVLADQDTMSPKDDLVGSISFQWHDIRAGKYAQFFWTTLYGAPHDSNNDQEADNMNNVDSLGSTYRGRLLMSIESIDTDQALLESREIEGPEIREMVENEYEATTDYIMRAMVFSGSSLPEKTGKFSIRVCFCETQIESSIKQAHNGRIDWYELLPKRVVSLPANYEKNMADIFVYLIYDELPVSYKRLKATTFLDPNAPTQWFQLEPDRALDKIKNEWEAGMAGVRIHIYSEDNPTDAPDWHQAPAQPPHEDAMLWINLYQCRNLPAADKSGLADPYLKFYIGGAEISTKEKPIEGTLNPTWYKVLGLPIKLPQSGPLPPIWCFVYDWDRIGDDDLMGMARADMSEASYSPDAPAPPQWRPLHMGRGGGGSGEILVSFNISPDKPQYSIEPPYEEVDIEINVLGLRDLAPAVGFLPVNKAFVRFDLKGLRLIGGSLIKNSLQSQPKEGGNNPNINTVLSFSCLLPKQAIYCPALTCTVHDQLFAGLSQPHIGTFSINLGDFKKETKNMLKKRSQEAEAVFKQKAAGVLVEKHVHFREEEAKDLLPNSSRLLTIQEALDGHIVRKPVFNYNNESKKNEEIDPPDPKYYMELGYNKEPDDDKKHYRLVLDDILEVSEYFGETPFKEYHIKKGQSRGVSDSKLVDSSGQASTEKVTGIFKGVLKITPLKHAELVNQIKEADGPNHPLMDLAEKENELSQIKEKLLVKTKCIVRVYVIDAFDLEQKDRGSHSDPYLRLKLGRAVIDDSDNHQEDTPNPKFFKLFEFDASLPGTSVVKVQIWDHDAIFSDEKIGTAKIDIEDRFFSKRFMSLPHKPIETRPLVHNSSRRPQGFVRLWIEVIPCNSPVPPIWDIAPRPPAEFEGRLIVWKSQDVEDMDVEGVSDLYIRAFIDPQEDKETDTHFRCVKGKGSWNWRLKFPLMLPLPAHRLTIQIWDRDYLSRSDYIAEATLAFDDIAEEAWENARRVKKYGRGEGEGIARVVGGEKVSEKFWVDCQKRNKDGELESGGKVMISFELVPKDRADACLVGEGRDEPNVDPYLPPPVGRFEWSLNPLKLISQMVGPEFKMKICCALCCVLCVLIIAFVLPMFFSDAVSIMVFGG